MKKILLATSVALTLFACSSAPESESSKAKTAEEIPTTEAVSDISEENSLESTEELTELQEAVRLFQTPEAVDKEIEELDTDIDNLINEINE